MRLSRPGCFPRLVHAQKSEVDVRDGEQDRQVGCTGFKPVAADRDASHGMDTAYGYQG